VPAWRLDDVAPVSAGGRRLLERRLREGRLSARGLDRVRRVALTVADLAGDEPPLGEEHILVALALRAPGGEGPGAWHEPVASYGTAAEARPW
jgi:predicted ATPase with chaperone activity